MSDIPRGIRNANPGNIKWFEGQEEWYGQIGVDDGFAVFAKPWQGYRAIARTLRTYQRKRLAEDGSAIDTVTEVIQRWAPAGPENPHQGNYIAFVLRRLGIPKGTHIDCEDFATACGLASAIGQFETGEDQPFGPDTDAQIRRGVMEAGIEPDELNDDIAEANKLPSTVEHVAPPKPLAKSRTIKAAGGVGLASVGAMAVEHIDEVGKFGPFINGLVDYLPWILGGVAVLVVGYLIWVRIDDRAKSSR